MTNITEETAISNEEVILGWQSQQWNIIIIICVRSIYVSKTHQPYNESKSNKMLQIQIMFYISTLDEGDETISNNKIIIV